MAEAFDGLLVVMLIAVGWRVVTDHDIYLVVILFVVLGMLLSLAWVRMGAFDIALAEAAIGTGLSGVLLLGALERRRAVPPLSTGARARFGRAAHGLAGLGRRLPGVMLRLGPVGVAGGIMAAAVLDLPRAPGGLTSHAAGQLAQAGVDQPVTAVLLSFRAYDTWLEVGVLLLAAFTLLTLQRTTGLRRFASNAPGEALVGALVGARGCLRRSAPSPWLRQQRRSPVAHFSITGAVRVKPSSLRSRRRWLRAPR